MLVVMGSIRIFIFVHMHTREENGIANEAIVLQ